MTDQRMTITDKTVEVMSEAYVAGISDDGHDFIAERFFVWVTAEDGTRWRHEATFNGAVREEDADGFWTFADVRAEASARAEALARRIRTAGTIDLSRWRITQPEYGSESYVREWETRRCEESGMNMW